MSVTILASSGAGALPSRHELLDHLELLAPFDANLRPPEPRPGIVERPALLSGLSGIEGVVLVTAPAGYGKTSLVAQWALQTERVAWLTVTPEADDVAVLMGYLARALDMVEQLPTADLAALTEPDADGPTVLLPRLGRVLRERSTPFGLVLDDVHLLQGWHSNRAIEVLVQHLPRGATLVLAGRHAPPLEKGRLRTARTVLELGPADLAMSHDEGLTLLRGAGLDVDPERAVALVDQMEGWPAGLYIAALAALAERDHGAAEVQLRADHPLVAEYVQEQVMSGVDAGDAEFLTRSSILDRLDGATCDALLRRSDSGAMLARLAATNLLVVPTSAMDGHYRYHHLFAAALQAELRRREPATEADLHTRASRLYAERDEPTAAIRHALLAGDVARAADLVWLNTGALVGSGRSGTVLQWLEWFGDDAFDRHPELCVSMALCCVTAPETRPIAPWIDLARRADPAVRLVDGTLLRALVDVLEAVSCESGLTGMVASADLARELAGQHTPVAGLATFLSGSGLLLLGRDDEARGRLEEAVQLGSVLPATAALALAQLAVLALRHGDDYQAEQAVTRAAALNERFRLAERPLQSIVFAARALVAARRGDSAAARRYASHARRLVARIDHIAPWLPIEVRILLARAELVLGEPAAARQLAREAAGLLGILPDPGVLGDLLAEVTDALAEAQGGNVALASPLTTAELRVLSYLPTHLSYQAIAEDLIVSRNTVKSHALAIFRKLHVSSRRDAVDRGRAMGLLADRA